MIKQLSELQDLTNKLKANSSMNDKITTLKNYPELKDILATIYNPHVLFNVTSANVLKYIDIDLSEEEILTYNLKSFIDALKICTGHKSIETVKHFIKENEQYQDLILKIVDKNLDCGINVSTLNKAFKDIIEEFSCALAYDSSKCKYKLEDGWLSSRKLDGCRCLAIIDPTTSSVNFFSRTGHDFLTLDKVKQEIITKLLPYIKEPIVLDGEICIMSDSDIENFSDVMKEIKRKNHTIQNPTYMVFDLIPLTDLNKAYGTVPFSKRYNDLTDLLLNKELSIVKCVQQTLIDSEDKLLYAMAESSLNGWEGVMLRKAYSGYEGKRTKNLMKFKNMLDDEFLVLGTINGVVTVNENGKSFEEEFLSAVTIEYKGGTLKVGSGFSREERRYFFKYPEKIIGRMITVKYFEESIDSKTGKPSLRFPVFKGIKTIGL